MNRRSWLRWLESFFDNRKSKIQNRKWVGLFAIVVALTVFGARAEAQQSRKIPRVGFLVFAPFSSSLMRERIEAFRHGLRELGYVEGKNVVIEYRYAEGKLDRLHALAAELVRLQYLDVLVPKDIETAFRAATKERAEAVLGLAGSVFNSHRTQVADLAVKSRLPAIYTGPTISDAGGLMSYGVSVTDLTQRAAIYVDKILRGAKPGDLPVEQPIKFELVINLKTAKQIGLTIPPHVLARADKVIK